MEFIVYIVTRIVLLICLAAIIYVITAPEEKISDSSDIW
ncbi:hypothetical protein SAMN05428947_103523 [Mucilaginibacter sp. OK283]|nr:hypothetical protein SAMN05428947_103523 [Mucilaginibacter sp. OK283]